MVTCMNTPIRIASPGKLSPLSDVGREFGQKEVDIVAI